MTGLNFTITEDGWFESQPIQVSGSIAINLTFGDVQDNRIVLLKVLPGTSMSLTKRILTQVLALIPMKAH